jgi:triacylglycerol esterase/lipase EstA (alpha/beta hydrolase family)
MGGCAFAQTGNDIEAIERLMSDNRKISGNIIDSLSVFRGNDKVDASNMIASINNSNNLMSQMVNYIYFHGMIVGGNKQKSNEYMRVLVKYISDLARAEVDNLAKMQPLYDKPLFYSNAEQLKSNLILFDRIISKFQYK